MSLFGSLFELPMSEEGSNPSLVNWPYYEISKSRFSLHHPEPGEKRRRRTIWKKKAYLNRLREIHGETVYKRPKGLKSLKSSLGLFRLSASIAKDMELYENANGLEVMSHEFTAARKKTYWGCCEACGKQVTNMAYLHCEHCPAVIHATTECLNKLWRQCPSKNLGIQGWGRSKTELSKLMNYKLDFNDVFLKEPKLRHNYCAECGCVLDLSSGHHVGIVNPLEEEEEEEEEEVTLEVAEEGEKTKKKREYYFRETEAERLKREEEEKRKKKEEEEKRKQEEEEGKQKEEEEEKGSGGKKDGKRRVRKGRKTAENKDEGEKRKEKRRRHRRRTTEKTKKEADRQNRLEGQVEKPDDEGVHSDPERRQQSLSDSSRRGSTSERNAGEVLRQLASKVQSILTIGRSRRGSEDSGNAGSLTSLVARLSIGGDQPIVFEEPEEKASISPAVLRPRPAKEARLCHFTQRYYCHRCHWGDSWPLPANMITCNDFSKYTVCRSVYLRLRVLWDTVKVDLPMSWYEQNPKGRELMEIRERLAEMRVCHQTCTRAMAIREAFFGSHRGPDETHLIDSTTAIRLVDVYDNANNGLCERLQNFYDKLSVHVAGCKKCARCKRQCIVCHEGEPIFIGKNAVTCSDCQMPCHKACAHRISEHRC